MGYIHAADMRICDPQSLNPIWGKFDKFLAHGQAHVGRMGKWPWQRTTRSLDNSTELRMAKIRQAVAEIRVPQVWQPPARPPNRPPARPDVTTIPPPARKVWRTDGRTDWTIHRIAWSQLKITIKCSDTDYRNTIIWYCRILQFFTTLKYILWKLAVVYLFMLQWWHFSR